MEDENANLLDEIYKATKIGLKATQMIIPMVHSEPLRKQIESQSEGYKGMAIKANEMLRNSGRMPKGRAEFKEAMLWSSIQANTALNKKPAHIAEIMINSTTMGITDMAKKLNQLDAADPGSKKLAEDFIANEQKNIEELNKHL